MREQLPRKDQPYLSHKRVLAIDPISRGFGFAVLEGPDRLIDWGVVHVKSDKHRGSLRQIRGLIDLYVPGALVVEDATVKGVRRCKRVRRLIAGIRRLARQRRITYRAIPRSRVRHTFSQEGKVTKHEIAIALAQRFPELLPVLPKPRKPWRSEDERMAIFDAVALIVPELKIGDLYPHKWL